MESFHVLPSKNGRSSHVLLKSRVGFGIHSRGSRAGSGNHTSEPSLRVVVVVWVTVPGNLNRRRPGLSATGTLLRPRTGRLQRSSSRLPGQLDRRIVRRGNY
eukprot:3922535-Rhodomonas_salina.1